MKLQLFIPVFAVILSAGCSSAYLSSSMNTDDAYYTPRLKSASVASRQAPEAMVSETGVNVPSANRYTVPEGNSRSASVANTSGLSDYERYRLSLENGEEAEGSTQSYYEDEVEYVSEPQYMEGTTVVNNYYITAPSSYMYRFNNRYVNSFYDPYYWDPWWDYSPWYGGYYNSFGFGWNSHYGWNIGFGYGWGGYGGNPYYMYDP